MLRAMMEYVILAIIIVGIILLSSCGPYEIKGKVTHKIEIDLVKLETYFEPSCQVEQPDNVQSCVTDKVGQFLQFVMSQ